jgi:uncharacterized protein (TIGR03067 family)
MSTTLFVGLAFIASAPGLKDPPGKPNIEGEWTVESSLMGGKPDKTLEAQPIDKIIITANKWIVVRRGMQLPASNFVVDPKQNPPHLDFNPSIKEESRTPGIYKIDGDTLTVCYVIAGDRPTKIESPLDSNVRMMTLKRLKK